MGIIGMKVYFRGMATQLPWYESVKPFLYYALSQSISTVVIGCDNLSQLEESVALYDLKEAFSESNLPIRVDIMDWARIPVSFHREIERAHVVVQEGCE